jgi:hypothetical protein|nr:MAG TPA: hypothetical protein [Caudoviricetes sp.]
MLYKWYIIERVVIMRKEGYSRCLDIINNVIEKINNKENIKDIKKYLENEKKDVEKIRNNVTSTSSEYLDSLIRDLK